MAVDGLVDQNACHASMRTKLGTQIPSNNQNMIVYAPHSSAKETAGFLGSPGSQPSLKTEPHIPVIAFEIRWAEFLRNNTLGCPSGSHTYAHACTCVYM